MIKPSLSRAQWPKIFIKCDSLMRRCHVSLKDYLNIMNCEKAMCVQGFLKVVRYTVVISTSWSCFLISIDKCNTRRP